MCYTNFQNRGNDMLNLDSFFKTTEQISIERRIEILKNLKNVIQANEEAIKKALIKDLGRSEFEAYVGDIGYTLHEIDQHIKNIRKWTRPKKVRTSLLFFPAKSYILSRPLGKILIIGPWNYPFQLLIIPLIGAISAGNRAILKPSEISKETSQVVKKIISENFDPLEIRVIEGGVEETTFLLEQNFDHIFYTGNGAIGSIVMEKAAKNLTPVTLELGGKSPALVFTKNIDLAAKRVIWGKFFNTGQTCVAPDYVLISKEDKKEFIRLCKKWIEIFYGKDPLLSADYGAIINERHFSRLTNYLEGAVILYGGNISKEKLKISPTLIEVPENHPAMNEEIFGPLLPIVEIENFQKACEFVEKRDHPLACYGLLESKYEKDFLNLNAGGMVINDAIIHFSNGNLPFGGVGPSGMGRYHGKFSFDTFSHAKGVMKRSFLFENNLRYPPYNGKLGLIKKLIQFFA